MSRSRALFSAKLILVLAVFGFAGNAHAIEPYFAEVTATEVNIRSGPSTNYYIVTKLRAGDRVEVRAEDMGWFGIVPTPGCFSLISKHYVDLDGNGRGVVNGNNVRVRAGSNRDASRYAVQVKLSEGAEVEVISEGPEGFLKIKPPEGAYIWIHGELVARISENKALAKARNTAPSTPSQTTTSTQPSKVSRPKSAPSTTTRIKTKPQPASTSNQLVLSAEDSTETSNDALLFEGETRGRGTSHQGTSSQDTSRQRESSQPAASQPAASQTASVGRSTMDDSTDRVAIYTWTGESSGTVRTTQPNATASTRAKTETADPAMLPTESTKLPANVSQGIPESSTAVNTRTTTATSVQTAPAPRPTTGPDDSRSTKRASRFANDSTPKVAIIRWDDAPVRNDRTVTSPVAKTPVPHSTPPPAAQSFPSTTSASNSSATSNTSATREMDVRTTQPMTMVSPTTTLPTTTLPTTTNVNSSNTAFNTNTTHFNNVPVQNVAPPRSPSRVQPKAGPNAVIAYTGDDPRAELKRIDDQLMIEFDKPLNHRDFSALMARYRGIMTSDADEASRQYAGRRIHQLEVLSIRLDAVGQMNNLVSTVVQTRETASKQRSTLVTARPQTMAGIVARGELRESMVFSSPVGPRRYRLIDPNESVPRTLCYVEIPRDSNIDVSRYLGRIVGVRASRQFVETGNVDPISVLVASSLEMVNESDGIGVSVEGQTMLPPPGITHAPSVKGNSQASDQVATGRMEPTYGP